MANQSENININFKVNGLEQVTDFKQRVDNLYASIENLNSKSIKNMEDGIEDLGDTVEDLNNSLTGLGDKIDDVSKESTSSTKLMLSGFNTMFAGITAGLGVMNAFGDSNADVTKSIAKLQSMMAILNFTQQLQNDLTTKGTTANKLFTASKNLMNIAIGKSTGMLKLFRLALIGVGIGAVVVAVALLVANWTKITKAIEESTGAISKFKDIFQTVKGFIKAFSDNIGDILMELIKKATLVPRLLYVLTTEGVKGAMNFIKNEIDSFMNVVDNVVEDTKKNKKEIQDLDAKEQRIKQLGLEISRDEAKGIDATTKKIELKRLELSLLEKNTKEYYDKQKELYDLQASQKNAGVQAQIGKLNLDITKKENAGLDATAEKIKIKNLELSLLTKGTKEYYDKLGELHVLQNKVDNRNRLEKLHSELELIRKEANSTTLTPEQQEDIRRRFKAKEDEIKLEEKRIDTILNGETQLTYIQGIKKQLDEDQAKLEAMHIDDMNVSNKEYVELINRITENKGKIADFDDKIKEATKEQVKDLNRVAQLNEIIKNAQEAIDNAKPGEDITKYVRQIVEANNELDKIKKNYDDISKKMLYITTGQKPVFDTNKKWKDQLTEIKQFYEDIAKLQGGTLTDDQKADQKNTTRDGRMGKASNVLGTIDQSIGALGDLSSAAMDTRLAKFDEQSNKEQKALEDSLRKGYITQEEYEKKKLDLEKRTSAERNKLLKKQFKINKQFQLAGAITAGAAAVVNGLMTQPFVPNGIIAGTLAGVIALANITKIASQKFQGEGGGESVPSSISSINSFSASPMQFNPNLGVMKDVKTKNDTRVYVLESDITKTQNNVKVIENTNKYN